MTTINLTPEPGDELVRMKNSGNSDAAKSGDARVFRRITGKRSGFRRKTPVAFCRSRADSISHR